MKKEDMILVSVDDHIVEPKGMFDQHLSGESLATAPTLIRDEKGMDFWWYEGMRLPSIGLNAVVGRPRSEYGCEPNSFDQMRRGAFDSAARVDDMNANGLLASMNFPSFPGFDGGLFTNTKDKGRALTHLKAYNDWHIDEWCGKHPGRFIPMAIIPLWSPLEMVKEVQRVVSKGCHSITFTDNPAKKGMPSIHMDYWEPLWKVCAENEVVINIHIGSGTSAEHASNESPMDAWITGMPISIANSAADWLYLQALQRYPTLKIALSEGGIGWIPYFLERADFTHEHHHQWTHTNFHGKKPSDVFREHFITCFIDDKFGIKNRHDIGVDNICYECDYPHSDTVWPEVPEYLMKSFVGVPDDEINKMTHLNAMRLYKFDPFSILGRENCTVGALRALAQAKGVDTSPVSQGGPAPLAEGEARRIVTSGDVMRMFAEFSATVGVKDKETM